MNIVTDNIQSVTIGYRREDGDIEVLATLNNTGEQLSQKKFEAVIKRVVHAYLSEEVGDWENEPHVSVWAREDVPDLLEYDEAQFVEVVL